MIRKLFFFSIFVVLLWEGASFAYSESEDKCGECVGNAGLLFIGGILIIGFIFNKGNYGSSSNGNFDIFDSLEEKERGCPGYMYSQCCDCYSYDPSDQPVDNYGYAKCNYLKVMFKVLVPLNIMQNMFKLLRMSVARLIEKHIVDLVAI